MLELKSDKNLNEIGAYVIGASGAFNNPPMLNIYAIRGNGKELQGIPDRLGNVYPGIPKEELDTKLIILLEAVYKQGVKDGCSALRNGIKNLLEI